MLTFIKMKFGKASKSMIPKLGIYPMPIQCFRSNGMLGLEVL